jgi:EF-hand domain-containing protein 1
MNLNVYGRVFRIVDCDEFTRRFFLDQGQEIGHAEVMPDDKFATTRAMINFKQNPPDLAESKNYIEVSLKGGRPNKNLHSFLANDRNVLAFNIRWNDTSYDGGEKFFVLNFFLSDNSVEVKEINKQNSGHYPFPMLLKRQKLAKQPIMTHCPGMSLRTEEYYMPEDLKIGNHVVVFGRNCQIYDCDAHTRQWYRDNFGYEQSTIAVKGGQ